MKEELNDIFNWDVYNWSRSIEFWESQLNFNNQTYNCLEIGAGPGGISVWLSRKGHKVLCTDCYDISNRVKPLQEKYGVTTINYAEVNSLNIPYENEFDIVILKSVLGGVGNDENVKMAIKQIYKSLKPGGCFVFVENLHASAFHMMMRRKFSNVGRTWNYLNYNFFLDTLSIFREFKLVRFGILGVFGRNEFQKAILGKLDKYFLEKVSPKKFRYIVAGVAKK